MASKQSIEKAGGTPNGAERFSRNDGNDDGDAAVIGAAEEFLAAQMLCSRTNVEGSLGVPLSVCPSLLGYDRARAAREDAFSRLRKTPARTLPGLAAKRVVLMTLMGLLGSDDPKIFEYAVEMVEQYHVVLVAVWPGQKLSDDPSNTKRMDSTLSSLPLLVEDTETARTACESHAVRKLPVQGDLLTRELSHALDDMFIRPAGDAGFRSQSGLRSARTDSDGGNSPDPDGSGRDAHGAPTRG